MQQYASALGRAREGEVRSSLRLAALAEVALQLAAAESIDELTDAVIMRGLQVFGADGGALAAPTGPDTLRLHLTERKGRLTGTYLCSRGRDLTLRRRHDEVSDWLCSQAAQGPPGSTPLVDWLSGRGSASAAGVIPVHADVIGVHVRPGRVQASRSAYCTLGGPPRRSGVVPDLREHRETDKFAAATA